MTSIFLVVGIFLGIFFVVSIFFIIISYNNFKKKFKIFDDNIKKTLFQINQILSRLCLEMNNLINNSENFDDYIKENIKDINKLKILFENRNSIKEKSKNINQIKKIIKSLYNYSLNKNPKLKFNNKFIYFQNLIIQIEEKLSDKINLYNQQIEKYNIEIEKYSYFFLRKIFSYKKKSTFNNTNENDILKINQ